MYHNFIKEYALPGTMPQDHQSVVQPKMAKILMLRGLGYSQSEIATRISVSQQTVSYYLQLMKSKAESTSPEEYFRSFIPYFSDKPPVIPTETRIAMDSKILEYFEELKDLASVTYVPSGVEASKITLSVDDMTEFKKEISEQFKDRIEMDDMTEFKKEISEQYKKDRLEMDSIMKCFEEENRKGVKILADELTRLSELMNNSDVNRRR